MIIAAIYPSPYNKKYNRLEVLDIKNLPKQSVNLVAVEEFKPENGLPYCIYNNDTYHYKNGQYYHSNYMDEI